VTWINNALHSGTGIHKVPEELRFEIRRLINIEYDETMNDILAYIVTKGPTTLYKVSRDTPYSISSIYKKAKRMTKEYLIRAVGNGSRGNSTIYEVTIKGLLLCLAHNCVDDDLVLSRLRHRWGLRNYDDDKLIPLLMLIPHIIRDYDLRVLENIDALMIMILGTLMTNQQTRGKAVDEDIITSVRSTSIYYVVNNVIMNNLTPNKKPDIIIIGNNPYLVGYSRLDNTLYVYMCRLCTKSCLMTLIPVNFQCRLANELNKAVINMVR